MAVVVMRMVPAVRAGVVFTIDPARSPGQARIEAVEGLGESLVSGQRTPEAHVVPRRRPRPGTPDEIVAALDAALVVEAAAGAPQDVEWVFDGDRVWIVQARPITVSDERGDGFDSEQDDHELTTAGIGEMLPGVLSPMAWDLNGTFVNEAFRHLVAGLGAGGAELEAPFVRRVSGRAALDFTRLRELAVALPGGSAEELELQYFGSRRPGRPAAEPAPSAWWRSLLHDLRAGALLRRANLDAEICVEAVADLADDLPNLDRFDAAALLSYRNRLCDLALRAATAEMAVAAAATSAYRKIELLLMPHLGAADAGRFAERATMGRGVAVVPQRDSSAALFGGPTWRQLGREPVVPIPSEGASRAWNELLRALDATSSWGGDGLRDVIRTRALRRIVDDTVALLHRREAVKAAFLRLGGEVRRVDGEIGDRLVARGLLDDPLSVELLTRPELAAVIDGRPLPPVVLATRRRWFDRQLLGPPLPVRFVGVPEREAVALPPGGRFEGWAASPGRHEGRGVVVRDAAEDLPAGAVLVAVATDPSWSPLFLRAGAIVCERGGPLSHAAILARELGVPAVLNVVGATDHLDGAMLTVDGDAGVVVLHGHDVDETSEDGP
jgi:pyruvate,water dikinase